MRGGMASCGGRAGAWGGRTLFSPTSSCTTLSTASRTRHGPRVGGGPAATNSSRSSQVAVLRREGNGLGGLLGSRSLLGRCSNSRCVSPLTSMLKPRSLLLNRPTLRFVHEGKAADLVESPNRTRVLQIRGMLPLDLIDSRDLRNEIDRIERSEHIRITPLRYCSYLVSCTNKKLRARIIKLADRVSDPSSIESASNSYAMIFRTLQKAQVVDRSELDALVATLLARMRDEEVPVSSHSLNSLLSLYIAHKDIDKAQSLFDFLREGEGEWKMQPSVFSYTTLIRGFASIADLPDALHYFEQMKLDRIQPDRKVYTALLQVCAEATDLPQALHIWNEMLDNKIEPDTYACNTLINVCNKALDFDMGYKILNEMQNRWQAEPDSVTYTMLIDLCGALGDFTKAHELMNEMKKQGIPLNVHTYTTLISAYARTGEVKQCFTLLDTMIDDQIRPNSVTLSALVHACLDAGDFREAVQTLGRMKREFNIVPDSAVLRKLISMANPKVKPLDLFRLIEKIETTEGKIFEDSPYRELIKLSGKRQELEVAFLAHERAFPNTTAAGRVRLDRALLLACLEAKAPQKALNLIDSIIERENAAEVPKSESKDEEEFQEENIGSPITVGLFNSLLQSLGESAIEPVIERMKILRIPPDTRTIDLLITHFESRDQLDRLWSILRELQDERIIQQDEIIYDSFIKVFLRRGETAKAHAVLTQLLERNTVLPPSTYHLFLESPRTAEENAEEDSAQVNERAALIPELVELMYQKSPSTLPITALSPFIQHCVEHRDAQRLEPLMQLLAQKGGLGKDLVERVLADTAQERITAKISSSAVIMRHLGPVLKALILLHQSDEAIDLLGDIRQRGIRVNANMYHSLVRLASPGSPGSALRLRALMRHDRVPDMEQNDPFAQTSTRRNRHQREREAQADRDGDEQEESVKSRSEAEEADNLQTEKEKRAAEKKLRRDQRRQEKREELERLERAKKQAPPRPESMLSLSLSLLGEKAKGKVKPS